MNDNSIGVVIPAAANREQNVIRCLDSLNSGWSLPEKVIIVCDSETDETEKYEFIHDIKYKFPVDFVQMKEKHKPGMLPPRSLGAKALINTSNCRYVWFLDSDIVVDPTTLWHYEKALKNDGSRILIGPYEWLPEGSNPQPDYALHNDPRWALFRKHEPDEIFVGELHIALANFSGNLVWPLIDFTEVGGFHPELHAGRCDDGELGLRAAFCKKPMSLVAEARGWHIWHPVNSKWVHETNKKDVPKINEWHPWVQEKGVILSEEDGARLNYKCSICEKEMNTLLIWEHKNVCH